MKRFYECAEARAAADGHEILLDGKPVRTPGRAPLIVPTPALAEAIAGEWNVQGETIDARAMVCTGLANAAIDRVAPDPPAFAARLASYGESDLLCYRAGAPAALAARQEAEWSPLLDWARHRFDVDFEVTAGIIHRCQPANTVVRLRRAVEVRGAFELAALSPLVTISGSLVVALALAERAIDLEAAWRAASVDDAWQAEKWGEDPEAARALEARQREFGAAHRFLDLLR